MMRSTQLIKVHQLTDSGNESTSHSRMLMASSCFLALGLLLLSGQAYAKPGTHGRAISTWDTTRSTVAMMYHRGFILEGGSTNNLSYNVNFTNTTGKLGSQFGLQYMNLSPDAPENTLHGGSVAAVALYGIPMGERYDNGLPRAAFSIFIGTAPAVFSNGKYTYTTFPLVFGLGVEISPIKYLSITPWVEGAPSFNFDTVFKYEAFQNRLNEGTIDDINIEYGEYGEIVDVSVDNSVVDDLIDDAVEYEMSLAFRFRGGLSIAANIGDRLDVQLNASVAQIGNDFDAKPTICIGGGLVFAWDDAPLGILPEETRAETLSCRAVEARYQTCGEYRALIEETRKDEREIVEKECGREIIVHEDDAASDDAAAKGLKPLSPTAVGISASQLEAGAAAEPPVAEEPPPAAPIEESTPEEPAAEELPAEDDSFTPPVSEAPPAE